jgi:hypothetical protein
MQGVKNVLFLASVPTSDALFLRCSLFYQVAPLLDSFLTLFHSGRITNYDDEFFESAVVVLSSCQAAGRIDSFGETLARME